MACGGELVEMSGEEAADRVPPRTLAWLDRFGECGRCRQVFWKGTHRFAVVSSVVAVLRLQWVESADRGAIVRPNGGA